MKIAIIFSLSRTRKMGRWGGQGSLENGIMGCSASENCLNRTKKGSVFPPCLLVFLILLVLSTPISKKPTPVSTPSPPTISVAYIYKFGITAPMIWFFGLGLGLSFLLWRFNVSGSMKYRNDIDLLRLDLINYAMRTLDNFSDLLSFKLWNNTTRKGKISDLF
jgi:hypothetical protein